MNPKGFFKILLKLFLFVFCLSFAADASTPVQTLTEFEGLESTFYSSLSGKAYLSLKYESAEMKRPKIGFLKFGMSFLEVKDLYARLDLRHAKSEDLFSKWKNLLSQKAIRYVTLEPISILLIDRKGYPYLLKAQKGKLSASGRLVIWGDASIERNGLTDSSSRLAINLDSARNCVVIEGNMSESLILSTN